MPLNRYGALTRARGRSSYYGHFAFENERKRSRIKRTSLVPIIVFIAAFIVIGMILIGFFSSFFDVKVIKVAGDGKYTEDELVNASGLKTGVKLYSSDTGEAREKILASLTYLKDVKIRKILPSSIEIEPIYEVPKYYIEVTGEYFTLSDGLRVLERLESAKKCEESGLVFASLPNVKRAVTGEKLAFFSEKDDYISEFLTTFSASSFYDDANRVYIKNKFNISVVKKEVYRIELGSFRDSGIKLVMAEKVLNEGGYRGMTGVILDVSDVSETAVSVDKSVKIQ